MHVVRHRQVETGGREGGIKLNGRLEPLYSFRILRALESLHALIQIVARLEFVAAGGDKCQRGDPNQRGLVAFHYCPASIWRHQAYFIDACAVGDIDRFGHVLIFQIRVALDEDDAFGAGLEDLFQPRSQASGRRWLPG